MSRVTRTHTWRHRISSEALRKQLGLDTIDYYVSRRQLRWLGHVARMDFERLPRRMLSSWLVGAAQAAGGRTEATPLCGFRNKKMLWKYMKPLFFLSDSLSFLSLAIP